MSYAGMYDPSPLPEPKNKPTWHLSLVCGHIDKGQPWWMSEPLYGGWKVPAFAFCHVCNESRSVVARTTPTSPVRTEPE